MKQAKGFTLLEILIYIAIINLVMTALFTLVFQINKENIRLAAIAERLEETNFQFLKSLP
ncbi:MAG TPA: type II secretion system protein [Candidatus Paceibacterota bacterium]|nr:type II secretion system protein [Candidatus Paceibacterota bacterium]